MTSRLFPAQADNRYDGQRAALWLLGLYVSLLRKRRASPSASES